MTDEITPSDEDLAEVLKPWTWNDFEDTVTGHKKYGRTGIDIYDFYLRVGYFMKRPMRVIISCGKYVWMKNEEEFSNCALYPLDPANPGQATYPTGLLNIPMGWRPAVGLYSANPGWVNVTSTVPGSLGMYPGGSGGGGYSTYTINTTSTATPASTIASAYQQGLGSHTYTPTQQAQLQAQQQQYGGFGNLYGGLGSFWGKLTGW